MFGATYFGEVAFGQTATQTVTNVPCFVVLSVDPALARYAVGDLLELTASFLDADTDTPVDPLVVAFTVHAPNGALTSATPTREGIGVYTLTQSITGAGLWRWAATGTGYAQAAADAEFFVEDML